MNEPAVPAKEPVPPSRRRRFAPLAAVAVAGVCVGVAGTLGVTSSEGSPAAGSLPTMPIAGLEIRAVGAWARIHPAGAPELCVEVAQTACSDAAEQRYVIEPLDPAA